MLQRSKQLEQEAIAKRKKEEADKRQQIILGLHQEVATVLLRQLALAKVPARLEQIKYGWHKGLPAVIVGTEAEAYHVPVEISEKTARYSDRPFGVQVKVGTYGDHPQTWSGEKPEDLNYKGIVASIQRRLRAKDDAAKRRKAERLAL